MLTGSRFSAEKLGPIGEKKIKNFTCDDYLQLKMKVVKVLVAQLCLLFVIPWTVAHQAPPSMGFPREEYWSGLPFSSQGHLPDPGIKPTAPVLAGGFFTTEPLGESYKL